jgi:hypothetical protein
MEGAHATCVFVLRVLVPTQCTAGTPMQATGPGAGVNHPQCALKLCCPRGICSEGSRGNQGSSTACTGV